MAEIVRVLPAGTMDGVPIEAHLDAAAATGFDAVSLRPRHLRAWLGDDSDRRLDQLAVAAGGAVPRADRARPGDGLERSPVDGRPAALPVRIPEELDMAAVPRRERRSPPWCCPRRAGTTRPGAEGLTRPVRRRRRAGREGSDRAVRLVPDVECRRRGRARRPGGGHQRRSPDRHLAPPAPGRRRRRPSPASRSSWSSACRCPTGPPPGRCRPPARLLLGPHLARRPGGRAAPRAGARRPPVPWAGRARWRSRSSATCGDPLQRAARAADALDAMLGATEGWADG